MLLLTCAGSIQAQDRAPEDALRGIVDLARAGATQLAIQAMDARQPNVQEDLAGWLRWERERVFVLLSQDRWQALADRLAAAPEALPTDFYVWAREMRARALLQLGRGNEARRELGRNLWSEPAATTQEASARWRRAIIATYLADGLDADADRAMIRYRREYGDAGEDWPTLRAEVLLRTQRPSAALAALPEPGGVHVEILRQTARLRSGAQTAQKTRAAAQALIEQTRDDPVLHAAAWALSAEAAQRRDNFGGEAKSLEQALGQTQGLPPSHPLAKTGDDLWAAYRRYGLDAANQAGLLLGDEAAWFALVTTTSAPVQTRALLATLALDGPTAGERLRAHAALTRHLLQTDFGPRLLPRLYLKTRRFPETQDIPPAVRHALAERYLEQGRILDASTLVSGLEPLPEGADPFTWPLRRSRILLLAGRAEEAYAELERVLQRLLTAAAPPSSESTAPSPMDPKQVDPFLQVVFDLQAVERHDLALPLFRRLLQAPLNEKQRRELYFWSAESAEALGDRHEATLLYLRSAMYPTPFAMDPWAQTARFQAARLLAEQGLIEDARSLYQGLLEATQDPVRQAVLRQRIQQLMLRRRP